MKNSNTVIQSKEEKKMKITTIVKVSVYAATLGFVFMLPVTAHAQMDVAPDEFAFSAPETTAAQPVQVANANATKADFEGKVSLPYAVKCGNKNLKAGQYLHAEFTQQVRNQPRRFRGPVSPSRFSGKGKGSQLVACA
jgi:hypothetical protein